jgi:hypothetical protein
MVSLLVVLSKAKDTVRTRVYELAAQSALMPLTKDATSVKSREVDKAIG